MRGARIEPSFEHEAARQFNPGLMPGLSQSFKRSLIMLASLQPA
jgi:hypothetical protein